MNGTVHSWFRGYVWRWLMALTLRIGCRCLQGTRDDIVEERSHPQFMAIETWNMMIKHIVSLGVPIFWDIPRWSQMNKGNQKYKLRFHSRWSHGFSLVVIMFSPSHCGIGCQNAVKIHDISLFLIWSMYDCLNMFIAGRGFVSPYWFVYCWPSCPESPLCDVYVSCFPCSVPHDINSPGDGDVCCSAIPPISPGGLRNVGRVTNKGSLIIWSWQTTINLPGIIYTHIHTYVQT